MENSDLSSLFLEAYSEKFFTELGIDSYDQCLDKEHFKNYPYPVFYFFNKRGFRDDEWLEDMSNKIWCIGDSFTVGLGLQFEHIWPKLIPNSINISLNGASNDWIARQAVAILEKFKPSALLIQWSYLHRRESKDSSKDDVMRMMHYDENDPDDIANFEKNVNLLIPYLKKIPVIMSFIPKFHNLESENDQDISIYNFLGKEKISFFPAFEPVDLARDSHHYGKKTAELYAEEYVQQLNKYGM
jgi:hypothetical protein